MRFLITLFLVVSFSALQVFAADETKTPPASEEKKPAAEKKTESADKVAEPAKADPQKVVVTVNGDKILEGKVQEEAEKRIQAQMKTIPPGMNVPEEQIKMMRDQVRTSVVEMLIEKALIEEKLEKKDIKVTDEDVQKRIDDLLKQQGITMEQLKEQAQQYGMSMDDVRSQFRMAAEINALIDAEMKDGKVTEEEARKYYLENMQEFAQPERVTAAHILLSTQGKTDEEKAEVKKKAEEILQRAKKGEDFAALAKEYSEDPGSKDRGGEYTFPRGQMVKPFEESAFSLKPGQISDLVETQFGYHIIKKKEHHEAETQSFDKVKEDLINRLSDQNRSQFWTEYRQKMREEARIEYSPEEKARMDAAQQAMPPRMARPAPTPPKPQEKPEE